MQQRPLFSHVTCLVSATAHDTALQPALSPGFNKPRVLHRRDYSTLKQALLSRRRDALGRKGIGLFVGILALIGLGLPADALPREGWSTFRGERGLVTQYPAGIFDVVAGPTERGKGRKFKSSEGPYEFAAYSLQNASYLSPRDYLRKHLVVDPSSMVYRRVTNRFFVLSSVRNNRIFYSRCNFSARINCIYLEYPRSEKVTWDPIVTRISHSLRSSAASTD